MTDKKKIELLKQVFQDTIWMAIRYANGRHTFAPTTVRNAIADFKKIFPDWRPKQDNTIKAPNKDFIRNINFESDYLHDLFE